ncbi:hypothetical protein X741_31355 [Mesorhizobium sp. LNHC229A00]|nr:hypothetical protein X741_31355 [Mesorhizobium sp. LNHC229A00]
MLTLYDYPPSRNGWKVRVLLGLLEIPHDSHPVSIFEGESHTDAFQALNPAGAVPVLQLQDGSAIAESNAILTYLAEGTPFLPSDRYRRAKLMQWLFFEQHNVEPIIGSLRFWTLTGRLERNQAMVAGKREAEPARSPPWTAALARRRSSPAATSPSPTSPSMPITTAPAIAAFRCLTIRRSPHGRTACAMPSDPATPSIPTVSIRIPEPERMRRQARATADHGSPPESVSVYTAVE